LEDDTYREPSAQEREDTFLTPKDLQRELKIGQSLAYRLLKSGAIPSLRVGGVYRIRRTELERLTANSGLENA
jgi:excisionase family DNA binding protein